MYDSYNLQNRNHPQLQMRELIRGKVHGKVEDAIDEQLELDGRDRPTAPLSVQAGPTADDKFRAAARDGMAQATGIQVQNPAPGHEDFRHGSLQRLAADCLEREGVDRRHLMSGDQVARALIKRSGMSTSDFDSVMLDVSNKHLLKGFREAPRTFLPFVRIVDAPDFKTQYGVQLSEAPELDPVGENEEYPHGILEDSQESYKVQTYGKIVYVTRQMIVNDDTRAFTRLPQLFGNAAARKESDVIYSLLTGNPTMSDGNALFSSAHNNLEQSLVGHITSDRLQAGRAAMRQQTGPNGAQLDIQPRFILVPAAQETDSEVITRSRMLPESGEYATTDYNPWANMLRPIAEPRLDSVSTDAWYLAADPDQVDTIEMAYLGGNQEPFTEEHRAFNRDAILYKIRHEFGAGVMGWRGFYKNPGA
jgi:hypothetical protein